MGKMSLEEIKNTLNSNKHGVTEDLQDYLQDLIKVNTIDDERAFGVTKHIIERGPENLSENQLYVFRDYVLEFFYTEECERCFLHIPWSEMFMAIDDDYCGYCRHKIEKDE